MSCPSLFQINTRVWLREISGKLGHEATLADIPDGFLEDLSRMGFDWIWLLGVWDNGEASREIALRHPGLLKDYSAALSDFASEDVSGSPFAVRGYEVRKVFGGNEALRRLRKRLKDHGLKLLLDFVPNHTALDHPWVYDHPEYYVNGTEEDLEKEPFNYWRASTVFGDVILAHGRDPYFPGWTDTLQLNYRHPRLRHAVVKELQAIAHLADGARCDMAMLLLPDIIDRTWGDHSLPSDGATPVNTPFWPMAINRVREANPDFCFMAEAYWDLESELIRQGFDYAYDKRLYDRLRDRDAAAVKAHLAADPEFQIKLVRFLENHDEMRAATAFPSGIHEAAGVLAFLSPGLHLIHDGQMEGMRIKLPVQLNRGPEEDPDPVLQGFYRDLMECRKHRALCGRWKLLECSPAWEGNSTWDRFIAFLWEENPESRMLVAVNYGPTQGQCYVRLYLTDLQDTRFMLSDLMNSAQYEREGNDLARQGLYVDLPAWGYHVFEMKKL
jgi:hypothetical protein